MKKIIFPDEMVSFKKSRYPNHLKTIRVCSLFILTILLSLTILYDVTSSNSVENSIIFIALLFELSMVFAYTTDWLDKAASLFFIIAWSFTSTFTLFMFFTSLNIGLLRFIYVLPWVMVFIDFLYNEISFIRIQFIIPIIIIEYFSLFVLDRLNTFFFNPGTLEYSLIKHSYSIIAIIVLEISRLLKQKPLSSNDQEQKLI